MLARWGVGDGEIGQQGGNLVGDEIGDGGVGSQKLRASEQTDFELRHYCPVRALLE